MDYEYMAYQHSNYGMMNDGKNSALAHSES